MVHDQSDFRRWIPPSIEVDSMPSILPPLFNWLVFFGEVETLREELLDVFPGALGLVGLRHFSR
jgi:hypothetical protein